LPAVVQCHAPAGTVAARAGIGFAAGPQMTADIVVMTSVIVPARTTEHRRPLAIKNSNGRTMTL
jgi:hypothetical protein